MEENEHKKGGLPSFSVILVMMVLMVIGAAVLPMLNIQYSPQQEMQSLYVSFSYPSASARVVETDVTSIVEGVMNSLNGVTNIEANSSADNGNGWGSVRVEFKEGTDMEAARFEAATKLRQIRSSLPEGVIPSLSGTSSGKTGNQTLLSYTINADMPGDQIVDFAQKHIVTQLARIEGVEEVSTSGAAPYQWAVTFDPNSLRAAGLTPGDLSNAFGQHLQNSIIGTWLKGDNIMLVRLRSTGMTGALESLPIRKVNGRMFYLGDFATVKYQEEPAQSYHRINGKNTVSMWVMGSEGINTIKVTETVKEKMTELEQTFPASFTIRQDYDASVSLKEEIHKIFFRAIMSLAFLLAFVLLVSRSFRYLAIIGLTITVNLLSAVIFYKLFDIDIELFSMAGITVSLGIIIDTAIVMVDHFTYYKNRKVMTSIAGALLTTIAALLIIFFLPKYAREDLVDFVWVIIINLTLSMVVAFLFVPALLDKMPLRSKGVAKHSFRMKRLVARWSCWYARYIVWARGHRWVYIVTLILLFGIPLHLLPSQVHHKDNYYNTSGGLVGFYNKTIGGRWYQKNRQFFEYALGGSFNLFSKSTSSSSYYSEPELEKRLSVNAQMAEGCTTQQMNEIIVQMEEWLNQYDGIEMYETSVSGAHGSIDITFEKEAGKTRFPYELKQKMWAKAMSFGGATWSISSLDQNDNWLSNQTYRSSWDHNLSLYGYNYDMLLRYAEEFRDSLLTLKRITAADISGNWGQIPETEFYMDLDREKIAMKGLNLRQYLSFLNDQLYDSGAGQVFDGEKEVGIQLTSADKDYYDLWHVNNDMIDIDSTKIRLSDLGSITKRRTGTGIRRVNQEYVVSIGYEFIGSWELATRTSEQWTKKFNSKLPLGFHVGNDDNYWRDSEKRQQALLLFIVAIIIYMICAILFESLRKPLSIIVMIPLGFIGLFLSFPICRVSSFDQGGFAAMVMLCGIVVNASIYLISEYNTVTKERRNRIPSPVTPFSTYEETGTPTRKKWAACLSPVEWQNIRFWTKAYNRKIIPTLLTIISTVLGLIPFLFDGKEDNYFWYAFGIGVIGGMIFSIIALIFYMPVFVPLKKKNKTNAAD